MMHFGELDAAIPMDAVDTIRDAHPEVEIHLYDADHGFNCDQRASYNAAAAGLALERSLEFFGQHVG
jgi:carboxymethylenebutenolidase